MNIAMVGATGWAGPTILEELVDRGHRVSAIVRGDRGLTGPSLEEIRADAYDAGSLVTAFQGADAVVSAFNPGWDDPDLYENYLRGARTIQQAAKDAGVPRLLVLGGANSLYGEDGRQLIEHAEVPEPYVHGVRGARDYHAEILEERNIDWVFLSPPPLYGPIGPTERLGRYRTSSETPVVDEDGKSSISPADLAMALVDEVEERRHHRERFTVGY